MLLATMNCFNELLSTNDQPEHVQHSLQLVAKQQCSPSGSLARECSAYELGDLAAGPQGAHEYN